MYLSICNYSCEKVWLSRCKGLGSNFIFITYLSDLIYLTLQKLNIIFTYKKINELVYYINYIDCFEIIELYEIIYVSNEGKPASNLFNKR